MSSQQARQTDPYSRLRALLQSSRLWIFAAVLTLGITLILSFNLVRGPQVVVTLGQPAPQDVMAPQSVTYASRVLTERARQQAAAAVPDQYTPVDLSIGRAQTNRVQAVFSFMDVVRADTLADRIRKTNYLQAIENVAIEDQVAEDLLSLSPGEFVVVRQDVQRIVENTMREGVVEDQISDARRKAAMGASFELSPGQERVVTALAPQFVVPNIFFNAEATEQRQNDAMQSVEPITQIVTRDERIIRVGDIIDEEDIEMLEELDLLQSQTDWPLVVSALIAGLLSAIVLTLYWSNFYGMPANAARLLTILASLFLITLLAAKLMLPGRTIYSWLFPAATLSIVVAVIFDSRLSLVVTLILGSLAGYISQGSLEVAVFSAAGGVVAVLMLRDTQRINALFRAGLVAGLVNVAVVLVFRLPDDIPTAELMSTFLLVLINGPVLSAGLSLAALFLIGSLFRVTTPLQLQELSRLDHPLLQELLRRAPGTYHHSIMVANLAEQAAEKIKANSTLVRVGAFYHDVGKMNRPPFFSENQNGGNPHDNLDPYSSARIIISHVSDGLEMARRYALPARVRDFIAEHHGDRVVKVFYNRAVEMAEEGEVVDISRFRHKGPRPQSRETAIVQLADSLEATSSALRPDTEEAIEKLVNGIVDEHLREGQLDNSGLTLGDIQELRESFIKTLKGRFHTRVKYPGNEALTAGPTPPALPAPAEGGSTESSADGLPLDSRSKEGEERLPVARLVEKLDKSSR
jgi:cyclic-di-AMP phosphodiesterase PgpH